MEGRGEGCRSIVLFPQITRFEDNVSTILLPIVVISVLTVLLFSVGQAVTALGVHTS